MPTPQALESLRILAGNRGGSQVLPMDAYRFAGNVPTQGELESPFEQEQARRAASADARDREAVSRIQETNAGVEEYNRPDVTSVRNEQEAAALRKILMPIQTKGEYDVRAAQEHAKAAAANTQALIGGRQQVADTNQGAVSARAQAAIKAAGLKQQYQLMATDKVQPNVGFFEGLMGGRGAAKQKALADIQSQIDALEIGGDGGEEAPMGAAPAAAPSSAAELLARRRARTGGR